MRATLSLALEIADFVLGLKEAEEEEEEKEVEEAEQLRRHNRRK